MLSQSRKAGVFLVACHQTWSQASERLRGASCEDWELFIRFAATHPPLDIAEPLMHYNETAASNSRKYRQMLQNTLSIVESLLCGLSGWERIKWRRRVKSSMYFRAALSAADMGDPSFRYVALSLCQWPFPDEYARYRRVAVVAANAAKRLLRGSEGPSRAY